MFGEGKISVVHPLSVSNNKKMFDSIFPQSLLCSLSIVMPEKGLYKVVV